MFEDVNHRAGMCHVVFRADLSHVSIERLWFDTMHLSLGLTGCKVQDDLETRLEAFFRSLLVCFEHARKLQLDVKPSVEK